MAREIAATIVSPQGALLSRSLDRLSAGIALAEGRVATPFSVHLPSRIDVPRRLTVAQAEYAVVWLRDRTLGMDVRALDGVWGLPFPTGN